MSASHPCNAQQAIFANWNRAILWWLNNIRGSRTARRKRIGCNVLCLGAGVAQEHSRVNIWGYDLMHLPKLGPAEGSGSEQACARSALAPFLSCCGDDGQSMPLQAEEPRELDYAVLVCDWSPHQGRCNGRRCWTERRVEITMRRANSARGGAMYLSGQGLTWPPELLGVAQITQRVRVSCFRISRGGWV